VRGAPGQGATDVTGYSTKEVAEVLGLPSSTILSWTRAGLLSPERGPRGAYYFSFGDIAVLRSARELLSADVPVRRVKQTLEELRRQLPGGRPLSAVRLTASGSRVLVQDEGRVWDPESGQLVLDFAAEGETSVPKSNHESDGHAADSGSAIPTNVLPPGLAAAAPAPSTADDWYDIGVDLEASDLAGARDAYAHTLALDPAHAEAHLNLGRLLHESGDVPGAEVHYRAALQADPESARAFYNLGVALEDRGRTPAALEAYEGALRLDAELAVAHFNASRLCEAQGREADALAHLAAYKRILDRGGASA
jgi:DNA-binding transcriptional MerR regulator/Flp pilus assembly protein TadD